MELTNQQRVLEHLLAEARDLDQKVVPIDRPETISVRVVHVEKEESGCHLCPCLPLYTYEIRRGSSLWRIPLCEIHIQKKNTTLKALFPTTTAHLKPE